MKAKVLRGFHTSQLGKRAEGEVFEVPEGAKVERLIRDGYLEKSRAEATVDVSTGDTAPAPAAARARVGGKGARGAKK